MPPAIIGVSNGGGAVDPNITLSVEISDVVCEGVCPALLHILPLQSYRLTLRGVAFPDGLQSGPIGLGRSEVSPFLSSALSSSFTLLRALSDFLPVTVGQANCGRRGCEDGNRDRGLDGGKGARHDAELPVKPARPA